MDIQTLKEGDVLRYEIVRAPHGNHGREGYAIVREEDGALVARDTYWGAYDGTGGKALTDRRLDTAESKFNRRDCTFVENSGE